MDERTLRILEWDKIVDKIAEYCQTNMGKEHVSELRPLIDADYIKIKLAETSEARRIARGSGGAPFGGIRDIRRVVKRCKLGAVAEASDFVEILGTLQGAAKLKKFLQAKDDFEYLAGYASDMGSFRNLQEQIFATVNDAGEVVDHASPGLAKIRAQLRTFQNRIREKVDSILRASENQKYFQEAIVTIRNDRFVIPVKAEAKQFIPGIVHDQSASGATLFVEPIAVVEMNNQLRQLQAQEADEVYRILAALSAKLGEQADMLIATLEIIAYLDFTFAKARYAESIRAIEPDLNTEGILEIRKGRHPLLKGDVVPTDLHLGKKFNTLVITGPNTGGKTVTLKTAGLLTVMAQSGLHIPAEYGSQIAVFDSVFSDIGDEQSIEQSLSTFSSHMVHIVRILEEVVPNSLVLLDELGAGTDPTEGAALAMSILEHLHKKGVRTIATTHYSELKTFAYTREGIENASVEFDIETLKPTYKLLIGVPGSSNAFAIATRLGLPPFIVDRSKAFLTQEDIKIDTLIKSIEEDSKLAEANRREAVQIRLAQDQLKKQYEDQLEKIKKDRNEIIRKAHEEARSLIETTKRQSDEMISLLKQAEKENQVDTAARMIRDELRGTAQDLDSKIKSMEPKRQVRPRKALDKVLPGQEVHIVSLDQRGRVLAAANAAGEVPVQVGIMKMNVKLSDLERLDTPEVTVAVNQRVKRSNSVDVGRSKTESIATELDLRGLTVEEALERTDKYLDDAALAGIPMARIIHGKGTGALRQAVRDMLKGHSSVKTFRFGESGEGGDGVTVVNFGK